MEEAQPQVKVTTISTVTPAVPTERHRLFLSNLDLLWLPVNNVQRLLFYKISPENKFSLTVESLKKSLSAVLVHFYPLAGRLQKGESGRVEVDCNDCGVEFIEASIDIPLDDVMKEDFQHKPFFESLVRMARPFENNENHNTTLLSVQVTAFEVGGICIGTTLHHVIGDGNSFWRFMKSWAEYSRGIPVSKPPEHRRTIFKQEKKSHVPVAFKVHKISNDRIKGAQIYKFTAVDSEQENDEAFSAGDPEEQQEKIQKWLDHKTELVYSTFHFTEKIIGELKERARASSSFVAVAAQFWRCIIKAREIPEEEPVYFSLFADCRGRVNPPLPPTYFGNCLSLGIVQITAKRLGSEDVGFAAALIQELVNSCATEEQANNMIEWMEWLESPQSALPVLFKEFVARFGTNLVSWHRFPVYEVDYGWGKPLNVQAESMNEIGAMVLFCGRDERGSIVVSTRLPKHQMEVFNRIIFA